MNHLIGAIIMGDTTRSLVTDSNGNVTGVDTTTYHADGSSTTVHQDAITNLVLPTSGGAITGVTNNHPDGTSTNEKR
ncbi:hypothetical protein HGA64_01895 [Candidatus Falkowbacteria bacterium]|nr:hypothetical protein [Candidatus Falkowbacteria bacterium]